jgi:hypothetical protein
MSYGNGNLANAMLADRFVVISDQEAYREILDAARAGDDEAQVIIGALHDADERYLRGDFHCVDCGHALSPAKRRAGAVIMFIGGDNIGGSYFCTRCAAEHDDFDDFYAAFCRSRPPMQGGRA